MTTELVFEGESLTLATEAEFKDAVMFGRLISHEKGISRYRYKNQDFLLSDHDLQDIKRSI